MLNWFKGLYDTNLFIHLTIVCFSIALLTDNLVYGLVNTINFGKIFLDTKGYNNILNII